MAEVAELSVGGRHTVMPPSIAGGALADHLVIGDPIVHPAHGVGRFDGLEADYFDGARLDVLRLFFIERRLTVRVPVAKAERNGLRRPMAPEAIQRVLDVVAGTPRGGRGIWARRAIEFNAKVNSGDPMVVAEVLRDLGRNAHRQEQPMGERLIFEQAMDRLAGEIAAVEGMTKPEAVSRILAAIRPRSLPSPPATAPRPALD